MTNNIRKIQSAPNLPSVDEQKQYWDDRWDKTRTPNDWAIRRGQTIFSFLSSLGLNQPKILDIGCGTGWFTAELAKIGIATGIDLSEAAIEFARSQYPDLTFISCDLYEHSFSNETFDVVVAQEVIPHVQDQDMFLDLIRTILKPGGYLVLTMVNKFVIKRADLDHGPSSHIINWLSRKEIKRRLQPGFQILQSTTILPMGNKGVLRIVNSYKLNRALKYIGSKEKIDSIKERAGLGYTRIIIARKISRASKT